MATKIHGTGGKKTNGKTTQKTSSPSNQEKKEQKQADLIKKIKSLEDDNKRLSLENVLFKKNFDLREIIKALSTKGITEVDATEMAIDTVKRVLEETENKHSAEKAEMEKKHKKEIAELSKNLQGGDQLPTKSNSQDVTDSKSQDYLKSLLAEKQQLTKALDEEKMKHVNYITELEREVESLKAEKDELNKIIKILKTEKDSLEKKLEETEVLLRQKESEITNMKKDVKHVQTREKSKVKHLEKEETKKDVNHSHEGLKKTEELLSQKEGEVTDMKKELANITPRSQDTISKTVNPEDIHINMRESTKEIEKANSEKNALLAEKQKLEAEIQKLQVENKKQKESYEKINEQNENSNYRKYQLTPLDIVHKGKATDWMEREKEALLAEKQTKDTEIKTLQNENKALKQSEEKNKNLNEKLRKVEAEKDNLKQQVATLQKENDEVKYRLKESQSPSLSNFISGNDTKIVQQLKNENERLRTRLSEMAGAQMTLNNPNIADLSDAFRPTKLSEEYSQLYDNVWTDAFEEHGGKKEEDIIQILGQILLGSYNFCEKVCREFTVQLTNSSLSLPNSKPKTEDIPIVYKKQLQDMRKSFGVFLRNDVKESYRKQNTIQGGEKTKNYIDACVELCWLMVLQEPPVVIELPASKDSAFDSDTYRTYTKIGTKVDFVVWPALRLHEAGPLLTKGVAQGKN